MNPPDPDFPTVLQGEMDQAQLAAYVADLGALATHVRVLFKRGEREYAEPADHASGLTGLVTDASWRAVQLRYVANGVSWCDSLLRLDSGYRLIRMASPPGMV